MTFGDALELLKQGRRVMRRGWNGKNMYVWLNTGMYVNGNWTKPFIEMVNAQGDAQPGWLASQPDMLEEDWEEYVA